MLLLVVEADGDGRRDSTQLLVGDAVEQVCHAVGDVGAELVDVGDGRAGEDAALDAGVILAGEVVVGVEKVGVHGVEALVVGQRFGQDKVLEEPACVRQMPLRRADVGDGLDDVILGLQRLAELLGLRSDLAERLD